MSYNVSFKAVTEGLDDGKVSFDYGGASAVSAKAINAEVISSTDVMQSNRFGTSNSGSQTPPTCTTIAGTAAGGTGLNTLAINGTNSSGSITLTANQGYGATTLFITVSFSQPKAEAPIVYVSNPSRFDAATGAFEADTLTVAISATTATTATTPASFTFNVPQALTAAKIYVFHYYVVDRPTSLPPASITTLANGTFP